MSQILKDLNKLAAKMGAPVVGRNISEQVRAISTYYDGTSHGANIAERINEVAHSNIGSGSSVLISKTINQNGNYLATDDEADGYSDVKVNVQPTLTTKSITANGTYNASADNADGYSSVIVNTKTKWLMSHGTEYIRIPKEDLAFTDKPAAAIKFKILEQSAEGNYPLFGISGIGEGQNRFNVRYEKGMNKTVYVTYTDYRGSSYDCTTSIIGDIIDKLSYASLGYSKASRAIMFNSSDEPTAQIVNTNNTITNTNIASLDFLIYSALDTAGTQMNISTAKIAYIHLYDNDTLIFSGTPAIDPTTGKACLYDSVNDKYYGNANESSPTDFEIVEED